MDDATKQYLEGQLKNLATKDDLTAVETRISETLSDVVSLVDKRFDAVDGRLDSIEDSVHSLTSQIAHNEKRLEFIEDKVL